MTFITKDLLLACYLSMQGYQYRTIKSEDWINRVNFHFEDTEPLQKEIAKFNAGSALVEPSRFLITYKKTRGMVFSILER